VTAIRILGVDPGLNLTGYAVIEPSQGRLNLCEAGVVRGRQRGQMAERLKLIADGLAT